VLRVLEALPEPSPYERAMAYAALGDREQVFRCWSKPWRSGTPPFWRWTPPSTPSAANRVSCTDGTGLGGTAPAATLGYTYNGGTTTYTRASGAITFPSIWTVPASQNGRYARITITRPNGTTDGGVIGPVSGTSLTDGSTTISSAPAGTYTIQITLHATGMDAVNGVNVLATATSGALTVN